MPTVRYTSVDGQILAERREDTRKSLVADASGSISAVLANGGTPSDSISYWPLGEQLLRIGSTPITLRFLGSESNYQDTLVRVYREAGVTVIALGRYVSRLKSPSISDSGRGRVTDTSSYSYSTLPSKATNDILRSRRLSGSRMSIYKDRTEDDGAFGIPIGPLPPNRTSPQHPCEHSVSNIKLDWCIETAATLYLEEVDEDCIPIMQICLQRYSYAYCQPRYLLCLQGASATYFANILKCQEDYGSKPPEGK